MKYARIINNIATDVRTDSPQGCFVQSIADEFVEVQDHIENSWLLADGEWEAPPPPPVPPAPEAPRPPKVSVIEYKMLFTSAERIATKLSNDPVVQDLQDLMNDPRTVNVDLSLQSISDALDYMTHIGLIAAGRKAEILKGVVK